MSDFKDINQIVENVTIRHPSDIRPAAALLAELSESFGLRFGATTDISSRDDMFDEEDNPLNTGVFGWTDPENRWWDRPQLALKSPIALACRYESEPFWCNRDGARSFSKNSDLEKISFKRFFEAAHFPNALLMIPARLTFGRVGVASLTPMDEQTTDLSQAHRTIATPISVMVGRFLSTYALVKDNGPPVPSNCSLGRREVQCLYWASRGKTDRETAMILKVSHPAVRYHITRATEKLDCVNRAQAVFKAGQLGYLGTI